MTDQASGAIVEPNIIDKAETLAKRIEDGNKKMEELVARQEQVAAKMLLAGRSEAGVINKTPEQKKEDDLNELVKAQLAKYR